MIRLLKKLGKSFLELDDNLTSKIVMHMSQMYYWPQFLMVMAMFGIPWLFAWNFGAIGLWLDAVLGTGPHDLQSYASTLVRRIWTTVVLAPFMIYFVVRFAINRWRMRQAASVASTEAKRNRGLKFMDRLGKPRQK